MADMGQKQNATTALRGKATRSIPNAAPPSATPGTDAEIEESFTVEGNGNKPDGYAKLIRAIKVSGKLPANAWYRLGTGAFEAKEGVFTFKGPQKYSVTATDAQLAGRNLVIPAKTGTLTITYQWVQ
jgi:hypothetical protein